MTESIISYLLTTTPFVFVVAILAVYATYHITKAIEQAKFKIKSLETQDNVLASKVDTVEKKVDTIDKKVDMIERRVDTVEKTVGDLVGKVADLSDNVNRIATHLINPEKLPLNLVIGLSPHELTPLAEKILETSGGKKYVDENLTPLIKELETKNPKSGWDVENFSGVLLFDRTMLDEFIPIRNYVFQNPNFKIPNSADEPFVSINLMLITQLMGIYLRNRYFEKYPSLKSN